MSSERANDTPSEHDGRDDSLPVPSPPPSPPPASPKTQQKLQLGVIRDQELLARKEAQFGTTNNNNK